MACAWRRWWAVFAVVLLAGATSPLGGDSSDPLDILFIGNSLTYSHDLPAMVGEMLTLANIEIGRIEVAAQPNYGLEDHWQDTSTRSLLSEHAWDLVVMQQGPSATEGRPSLLEYSQKFATEIQAAGAEPALFMVWPSASRSFDFPGVIKSYRTAAERVDGLLLPVGLAWLEAWRIDPDLDLYGPDGFHPSRQATALASLVMALTLRDSRLTSEVAIHALQRMGIESIAAQALDRAARTVVTSERDKRPQSGG